MIQSLDSEIRQTYIILYEKDGIRYIFNRSIPWNSILKTRNIEKIINVLGREAIDHFIIRLNDSLNNLDKCVNDLTGSFIYDDTIFYILEIHPEWENIDREHQNLINIRKKELCEKYDAIDRKNDAIRQIIDSNISSIIKREFKKWLVEIYESIGSYAHLIQDQLVENTLYMSVESLKNDKKSLQDTIDRQRSELNYILTEIKANKKTLSKQNKVIDVFNKYINNLNDDAIQKFKINLINKGYE